MPITLSGNDHTGGVVVKPVLLPDEKVRDIVANIQVLLGKAEVQRDKVAAAVNSKIASEFGDLLATSRDINNALRELLEIQHNETVQYLRDIHTILTTTRWAKFKKFIGLKA